MFLTSIDRITSILGHWWNLILIKLFFNFSLYHIIHIHQIINCLLSLRFRLSLAQLRLNIWLQILWHLQILIAVKIASLILVLSSFFLLLLIRFDLFDRLTRFTFFLRFAFFPWFTFFDLFALFALCALCRAPLAASNFKQRQIWLLALLIETDSVITQVDRL